MRMLTRLLQSLEECHDQQSRVDVLRAVFCATPHDDMPWMLAVLLGRHTRKVINSVTLRTWAISASNLPAWLFEESLAAVGDVSETVALFISGDDTYAEESLDAFMSELDALHAMTRDEQQLWVQSHWLTMSSDDRFVFNKLLTGTLRLGVPKGLVLRALGEATGVDQATLAHRLMREWTPHTLRYADLLAPDDALRTDARPYPFCRPFPLDVAPSTLGDIAQWQAEWKWDGIRTQVIVRNGELFVWTLDEELVTDKCPELRALLASVSSSSTLPDGIVLDGELLALRDGHPLTGADVQRRLARKNVSAAVLIESPFVFMAFDVLEYNGVDIRTQPLAERRALLETIFSANGSGKSIPAFALSRIVQASAWTDLAMRRTDAHALRCEGLILKRRDSPYHAGQKRGNWWTWQSDPHKVVAVLVYAQAESTARDAAFVEYTFAVWKDDVLVPIAKTRDGLTAEDGGIIDAFIRKNTLEKFGPVRTVKPELVFDIGFESVHRSTRHKSGVAVRVPRILARRVDVVPDKADTIETMLALLA